MKKNIFILFILSISVSINAQQVVTKNQKIFGCIVKIKSVYSNKVMQVGYGGKNNNDAMYTFNDGNYEHCKWQIIDAGNGLVKIKNINSGKYLVVYGGGKNNGDAIVQYDDVGQKDVYWKLNWLNDNSFKLINNNSNKAVAIEGGSRGNARIIQWDDNNQGDIIWQLVTVGNCDNDIAANTKTKKIEVLLHTISVSEATRNRIDNGDCKRVFGQVIIELWETDNNGNLVKELRTQNNSSNYVFDEIKHEAPNPVANEYYNNTSPIKELITGRLTYVIPEEFINNQKIALKIKTTLGSRHKDNDFASYDYLAMKEERVEIVNLNNSNIKQSVQELPAKGMFEYMYSTEANAYTAMNLSFNHFAFPHTLLGARPDDSHKLWIHLSVLKAP